MPSSTPDNVFEFPSKQTPDTGTAEIIGLAPESGEAVRTAPPRRRSRWIFLLLMVALIAVTFIVVETRTSYYVQSPVLSRLVAKMSFAVAPGPSPRILFPASGPYDQRMGYTHLPQWIARLQARGYAIEKQAELSPQLEQAVENGVFPVYHEKQQAGLVILDRRGTPVFSSRYPRAIYETFEAIPPLVIATLTFIEDRSAVDPKLPQRNPAIAWERLGQALFDQVEQVFDPDQNASGGSTLATQLEKFRHSDRGVTPSITEKLRQVSSASLRAYLDGPNTLEARREIVRAYLNGVPLAARAGYGEVHGLQDGLRVWFDADPGEVNRLLGFSGKPPEEQMEQSARAYRMVLSLLLAQQRPTWFLGRNGFRVLSARVDEYVRVLARKGVLDPPFRDAVLSQPLAAPGREPVANPHEMRSAKIAYMIRSRLLSLLGLKHFYDLDRLDLGVTSTLDYPVQRAVAARLLELKDPVQVKEAKLTGSRLLESKNDLDRVIYSFTLYELTENANVLRVQADNFPEPFDINEGVRLDLGSTAKLRTLVHYLEIMSSLYNEYATLSADDLGNVETSPNDKLRVWVIDYLGQQKTRDLHAMLEAAMDRKYSASPAETFITGGGAHHFVNFKRDDNGKIVTIRQAFRESINLPFVRLMRDIVRYHMNRTESSRQLLEDAAEPRRIEYLTRFADREGKTFLRRFYRKYDGKNPAERFNLLIDSVRAAPVPLSIAFRSIYPDADENKFAEFLKGALPGASLNETLIERLYRNYGPDNYSLMDRGYLAKVHPLELWLVTYLQQYPEANFDAVTTASAQERIDVYAWLFKTKSKSRQDIRIRTLLEIEAFTEIHAAWARLGYPFSYLTPSYATAIGSSADRPAALAELMGIILRGGVRAPAIRLDGLHFAADTPYETLMQYQGAATERVLPTEVADVVHAALLDVVAKGTAVRLAGGLHPTDGVTLPVGGKTGTGDHRMEIFDAAGRLVRERVVNRTATFVFFIGDRYYGTVSAYVPGEDAGAFSFTSSLPVELLRQLGPLLQPIFLD
ncbi:MAG: transglycosylase domain-containing protein [Gammaproteobacteria bacterium]